VRSKGQVPRAPHDGFHYVVVVIVVQAYISNSMYYEITTPLVYYTEMIMSIIYSIR